MNPKYKTNLKCCCCSGASDVIIEDKIYCASCAIKELDLTLIEI